MKEYPTETEKKLLEDVTRGSEAAFSTLFNAYRDKLYGFVLKLSASTVAAEEVVQEVFLKIWTNREQLAEIDNFNAYLYRMAKNQLLNSLKRMSRETLILARLERQAPDQNTQFSLEAKELSETLQAVINELPDRQQAIYRLHREQGISHQEIAAQLGISISTVKNHMHQALKTLREKIVHLYPNEQVITLLLLLSIFP